jgi:transposase
MSFYSVHFGYRCYFRRARATTANIILHRTIIAVNSSDSQALVKTGFTVFIQPYLVEMAKHFTNKNSRHTTIQKQQGFNKNRLSNDW